MGFNWAARSIKSLVMRLLGIFTSNYFDDFPTLEDDGLAANSLESFEALLDLLGWKVSSSEAKRKGFAVTFDMLGVLMDLTLSESGIVEVRVTPGRREELLAFLRSVEVSRVLRPVDAAAFRGRFGFAYLSFEQRPLGLQLKVIGRRAEQAGGSFLADDAVLRALGDIATFLKGARPRRVQLKGSLRPLILYTDGACESQSTAGAVLYIPETKSYEYWGMVIPAELTGKWADAGVRHAVGQAEVWPVLISYRTWEVVIKGREILHFIDNEGVRMGLVGGNTKNELTLGMIGEVAQVLAGTDSKPWFARVPSPSNFSDDASRLEFGAYKGPSFKAVVPKGI